ASPASRSSVPGRTSGASPKRAFASTPPRRGTCGARSRRPASRAVAFVLGEPRVRPPPARKRALEAEPSRGPSLRSAPRSYYDGRMAAAKRRAEAAKTERREQILSAARDVFARRGYHQATIDDIVARAGVARGTFYLYFDDKRAVFSELIDRFAAQITQSIQRIVTDDPSRPVVQQVRDNIRAIVGTCLSERTMTKILFTDAVGVDSAFDRKLAAFYESAVQLLTESLKDGQALGIVGEGEPRVLAYLTIGALKELLYQAVTLGFAEETADVLTQQMFSFLSGGYLRVAPTDASPRARPRPRR